MEDKLVEIILELNATIKKLYLICDEIKKATDKLVELPPLPSPLTPEDYE